MPAGVSRSKSACKWFWKGRPALKSHGVYQTADAAAQTGAVVSIYKGAYDPKTDYTKRTPSKTATVALGTPAAAVPMINGTCTPVAHAFIDVPMTGNYLVATGHRVITSAPRMSAAYFHGPSLGTTLDLVELDQRFVDAVAASERHRTAGYMATKEQTDAGVADMASEVHTDTYGLQLWNYFSRSYPEMMQRHYGSPSGEESRRVTKGA